MRAAGRDALPGTDPSGKGDSWAVEISLDVEWGVSVAPGATIFAGGGDIRSPIVI